MSCRSTADSVADAYAAVGVPIRFILSTTDPDAMLDGTPPSAPLSFDWYAIPRDLTVQERHVGSIAESDIAIKFAHPAQTEPPAEIYAAILAPETETSLRVAVALDGEIGAPDGKGGFEGAKVYRFGSVLGVRSIRTPVAHTWHLGSLKAGTP